MAETGSAIYHRAVTQGGAVGAGRSTAIVLFTDLVGSTELRSRLGEDAAEQLRHKHDALVADAVEASRGNFVKNLGDGIMATFTGASDAITAAVAIQQAIGRHNRSGAANLDVRIGISAGDVVFEGDDCFGTPVIEAARLCSASAGGQILASELVRGLARSSGGTFTPVGSLELKGLTEPVPAVQVDWDPLPQSSVPLPTFLTDIGRIFVGRDGELERLGQLWKEAAEGELRVVLVAGEPGVGKTRLAAELARSVHDAGATVLAGRCDEDLGVPYQPFVEALRHFVDHAPLVSGRLGRYGGELARLVPELSEQAPGLPAPLRSDPETERYRLFDAVATWLSVASTEEPLLLVLDDLQWAAKPTLLLLRHVVRARGGRVLVLCTYRDTELTHDHPLVELVADLRRQGGVERLSLSGLDDVGVAAIVEQALGRALDEATLALAGAVYAETEGNPFFVREVLRHLAETGAVERREGGWTTRLPVEELGIPEGVREVVGRRLSRLAADTNQALRVAAVVGSEFELGVVQAAGDLGEETLLGAVEEAAAARVVTEVSATRFRFAHALVRATLYESLTAARKVTLHRKAAEAIETIHEGALDNYVPALAHHWANASAPLTDPVRAVDYARRAGDRALAQLAHDEAADYYASGLDLLDAGAADPADPRRLELLIGRGEAERRAGDPGYRQTLLDAAHLARQLGDAGALARAVLANTRGNLWNVVLQVDADQVEVLEAAIAAVGQDDLSVRARLLAALGLELAWEPEPRRRLGLSEEALRIASSLGDPATLAHVLLARDYTITAPDNATERFTASAQLLEIAEQLGDPVLASRALSLRFKAAMELADVAEAERSLARNRELVAHLGQPALTWATMHHDATLRVLHGDVDAEAAALAAEDFGLVTIGRPDIHFLSLGHWRTLRWDQGRIGEFEDWTRQVLERTQLPTGKAFYALILLETDQMEAAASVFDELSATGFAHPTNNVMWLMFATECAWVCARLGRDDCVPRLRAMLEPYAEQLVVGSFAGWVTGPVAFYLGVLATTVGDWENAEAHFASAAATHERIAAPTWLAHIRVEWARMLLARAEPGDGERALDLVRQALATARELGLANIERGAVELLGSQ
jgi:class 3 adenylate cyclase